MDMKVFSAFDRLDGMNTIRILEFQRKNNFWFIDKSLSADLIFALFVVVGVVVDKLGGIQQREYTISVGTVCCLLF